MYESFKIWIFRSRGKKSSRHEAKKIQFFHDLTRPLWLVVRPRANSEGRERFMFPARRLALIHRIRRLRLLITGDIVRNSELVDENVANTSRHRLELNGSMADSPSWRSHGNWSEIIPRDPVVKFVEIELFEAFLGRKLFFYLSFFHSVLSVSYTAFLRKNAFSAQSLL